MIFFKKHLLLFASVILLTLLLSSCATYHDRILGIQQETIKGNYQKANKLLDGTSLLTNKRNRLLYLLEKGKLFHLMKSYDSSNLYLNEADRLMESANGTVKNIALSTLLNPMMQEYQPEDFEKFMVHYYKSLNYLYLGNTESAIVEARRITLVSNAQEDKYVGKNNRYNSDPFSMSLQGMLYEKTKDYNNAFIAYRNAADVYLNNKNEYYGITIPEQLKLDVLRTASIMGFETEKALYEKKFNLTYNNDITPEGGEAIIFWENGLAPFKEEQSVSFNVLKNNNGTYYFTDAGGLYSFPFDYNTQGYNQQMSSRIGNIRFFSIALPRYVVRRSAFNKATLQTGNTKKQFEKSQDLNVLSVEILKQRFGKELGAALSRMLIKKLAEYALEPSYNNNYSHLSAAERKKEEERRNKQELLALGLKIFNRATEKADTRNWQSLPAHIFYTRIPLQKGQNTINITFIGNGQSTPQSFTINGTGALQFYSVFSIQ